MNLPPFSSIVVRLLVKIHPEARGPLAEPGQGRPTEMSLNGEIVRLAESTLHAPYNRAIRDP
jgi:hypothetical protein